MKKSYLFLLLLVLTMVLSACSTSNNKDSTNKTKNITLAELRTALESSDVELKLLMTAKM